MSEKVFKVRLLISHEVVVRVKDGDPEKARQVFFNVGMDHTREDHESFAVEEYTPGEYDDVVDAEKYLADT